MDGQNPNKFQVELSRSFRMSLLTLISEWQKIEIPQSSIDKFVSQIGSAINRLELTPRIYADVTSKYQLSTATRAIRIGHHYSIFYRIDDENKIVRAGRIQTNRMLYLYF